MTLQRRPLRPLCPARRERGRREAGALLAAQGLVAGRCDLEKALQAAGAAARGRPPSRRPASRSSPASAATGPSSCMTAPIANLESVEEVFAVGLNRAVTLLAEKARRPARRPRREPAALKRARRPSRGRRHRPGVCRPLRPLCQIRQDQRHPAEGRRPGNGDARGGGGADRGKAKDGKARNGKSRTARKPAKKAKATAARPSSQPRRPPPRSPPPRSRRRSLPPRRRPSARLRLPNRQARREPQTLRQTEAETGATDFAERSGDPRIHRRRAGQGRQARDRPRLQHPRRPACGAQGAAQADGRRRQARPPVASASNGPVRCRPSPCSRSPAPTATAS